MDHPASTLITLLFADVEGSTRRWEADPAAMHTAVATQQVQLRAIWAAQGGEVFKTVGEAFYVRFPTPATALAAAVAAQQAHGGDQGSGVRGQEAAVSSLRIAIHTG